MPDLIRHPCLERSKAPPWIAGQACPELVEVARNDNLSVMPDLIRHPCLERSNAPTWIAGQACPELVEVARDESPPLFLRRRRPNCRSGIRGRRRGRHGRGAPDPQLPE